MQKSHGVSRKLSSRKIAPQSGSGFGLRLVLELGLGAIFLEPPHGYCEIYPELY